MISASLPGIDLVQLVLAEQREDLVLVVDERHHLVERHAGDEEAGPQHHVHHRPVARRDHRRLRQLPAGVLELRARRVDLRLRDLHLRLRRGDLRLDLRDRREVAVDAAAELFLTCCSAPARRELRGQLVDVRLRLLEVEAVAGARRDELGVLRDALPRQIERRRQRRHLAVASFSCSFSCRSLDSRRPAAPAPPRAAPDRRRPSPPPTPAAPRASDLVLVRRRIDPEQHVAFLHRPVVLDRHLDHPSAHLRHDRDDVIHHPDVARRRREDVQQQQQDRDRDHREDRDGDLPRRRPRQQLQLDEDQPDEERVDAEQQDFHYRASPRRELRLERLEIGAKRLQFGGGHPLLEARQPIAQARGAGPARLVRRGLVVFVEHRDACRCRRPSCT